MEVNQKQEELQGLLVFMSSLSHAMEKVLGRGASPITFRAGRTIGFKEEVAKKSTDLTEALTLVDVELKKRGINWAFELWKSNADASPFYAVDGKTAAKLVFHNCMVRCSLFRYSHEQKTSLCLMNHGLFCGYLEKSHREARQPRDHPRWRKRLHQRADPRRRLVHFGHLP